MRQTPVTAHLLCKYDVKLVPIVRGPMVTRRIAPGG